MFSKLFTKPNLPTIITLTLLILTTGFLFWYGSRIVQEANQVNTTIIAWKNLKHTANSKNNFTLIIKNLKNEKQSYNIDFFLNSKKIDSQKIEIPAGTSKNITPDNVINNNKKMDFSKRKNNILRAEINWNNNKKNEILEKLLINNNRQ